ncbi:MAG: hypothetical protein IKF82_03550 [Bacilli bacterium]|nr:hypothetical protein [Bacilli bacterium]
MKESTRKIIDELISDYEGLSVQEYISLYREIAEILDAEKNDAVLEYFDKLSAYLNSSALKRPRLPEAPDLSLFDKFPNVEISKPHQRYAVKYGSIVGPIVEVSESKQTVDNFSYVRRSYVDSISLDGGRELGDLASLWTVLEYVGNGIYKDLITGRSFVVPVRVSSVLDTVTQGTEGKAQGIKLGLLSSPLRIKGVEVTRFTETDIEDSNNYVYSEEPIIDKVVPALRELTPAIQESILRNTLPRRVDIISALDYLERKAKKGVSDYYEELNRRTLSSYYDDAMSHSSEMHRLEELHRLGEMYQAAEDQDAEAMERERKRQEYIDAIASEFESVFPSLRSNVSGRHR